MTEETYVDFKCPFCGEPNSFQESAAGSAQSCPNCQETLVVPLESTETGGQLPFPFTFHRLRLRRFHPSDWKALLDLSVEDGAPREEEEVLHWLEADQHVRFAHPGQWLHLAMELADSGKLLGHVSISLKDDSHRQAAVSLSARPEIMAGYGAEALAGVSALGFRHLGLVRIAADCESRDTVARQMMAAAGWRHEGEFRKDRWSPDGWLDSSYYALLVEEWAAKAEGGS
jgi:RimJ/RimL family protein N-acetyltransferase